MCAAKEDLYSTGEVCPYCQGLTVYVDSAEIYGTSYGMIYLCRPCHAWVGVHKGTDKALGRLADADLREWKKKAHASFDQIWKHKKENGMSLKEARGSAYAQLSKLMGIPVDQTHIGMFDLYQCVQVVELCKDPKNWDFVGPGIIEWAQQYGTVIDLRGVDLQEEGRKFMDKLLNK